MKILSTITCQPCATLVDLELEDCDSLDSPALKIVTDFTKVKPLVIEASTSAVEAERLMRLTHVRLKLVVDDANQLLGVVSHQDLDGQEVMKRVADGFARHELTVSDFMIPSKSLTALRYEDLERATIRDVLSTLRESPRQHCLVVDGVHGKVRGILSATNVIRLLRLPIELVGNVGFREVYRNAKQSVAA